MRAINLGLPFTAVLFLCFMVPSCVAVPTDSFRAFIDGTLDQAPTAPAPATNANAAEDGVVSGWMAGMHKWIRYRYATHTDIQRTQIYNAHKHTPTYAVTTQARMPAFFSSCLLVYPRHVGSDKCASDARVCVYVISSPWYGKGTGDICSDSDWRKASMKMVREVLRTIVLLQHTTPMHSRTSTYTYMYVCVHVCMCGCVYVLYVCVYSVGVYFYMHYILYVFALCGCAHGVGAYFSRTHMHYIYTHTIICVGSCQLLDYSKISRALSSGRLLALILLVIRCACFVMCGCGWVCKSSIWH
jgi:hypothetical protein